MLTVRRWYIYLVAGISLQAVTWAIIFLLRYLIVPWQGASTTDLSLYIAVIIIGAPIYLSHWLWSNRLADRDPGERVATLRRAYLYAMMAAFLIPSIANIDGFVGSALRLVTDLEPPWRFGFWPSPEEDLGRALIAIIVLGAFWYYHRRRVRLESVEAPEVGERAAVRRLYVYTFSAAGLIMVIVAALNLLMWIMFEVGAGPGDRGPGSGIYSIDEIARFAVGLPLWLIFWRWAQRLFNTSEEERSSVLRKLYLYVTVFLSAIYAVFMVTMLISDAFRQLLNIPSMAEPGAIRDPLASILVLGAAWGYHTYVIRKDMLAAGEGPRQAQIRRIYQYLMAAIGLAAFLIGLGGNINVLIESLSRGDFTHTLRDQAAWFLAATVVGLPVWYIPWRQLQGMARLPGDPGKEERRSIVRKIYLYLFLFVAAMTTLGAAIYIVAQIVDLILGGRGSAGLLNDLAQAIAFALIAVGVWFYHSFVLRSDNQLEKADQRDQLRALSVTVIDDGDRTWGKLVADEIRKELPDLNLTTYPTRLAGEEPSSGAEDEIDLAGSLLGADIIIGPWTVTTMMEEDPDLAATVLRSEARKLLIPTWVGQYHWIGVDRWKREEMLSQVIRALQQYAAGEEIRPSRPLSGAAIVLIVILLLAAFGIGIAIVAALIEAFF